jgi:hypothetical protein
LIWPSNSSMPGHQTRASVNPIPLSNARRMVTWAVRRSENVAAATYDHAPRMTGSAFPRWTAGQPVGERPEAPHLF